MKKRLLFPLLAALLLLSGCASGQPAAQQSDDSLHVLATTWPVYCFAQAVTEGAENVSLDLLVQDKLTCVHDYTLTVNDMKRIEAADVVLMSGVGLESFMDDALQQSAAATVDCSAGVSLLPGEDGENDPHIWLDPSRAAAMALTMSEELAALDPDNAELFRANAADYAASLEALKSELSAQLEGLSCRELIVFHDGFSYFADAFDLDILFAIEEEEGSEASAADIKQVVSLVDSHQLPAIFYDINGSDATAGAISAETGCGLYPLDTVMCGTAADTDPYSLALRQNIDTILEAFAA